MKNEKRDQGVVGLREKERGRGQNDGEKGGMKSGKNNDRGKRSRGYPARNNFMKLSLIFSRT